MRTILIALLLAGAASPVLAAGPGREEPSQRQGRGDAKSERKSDSEVQRPKPGAEPRNIERSAPVRSFEPRNVERAVASPKAERDVASPRAEPRTIESGMRERSIESTIRRSGNATRAIEDGPKRNGSGLARNVRGGPAAGAGTPDGSFEAASSAANGNVQRRSAGDNARELRRPDRVRSNSSASIEERIVRRAPAVQESGGLVEQKRPAPRVFEQGERRVSRKPVFGTEPPAPRTATAIAARPARAWSHDWRHDRKYDWKDWRRRHRSRFHFGFYNDPFGWSYFRYANGWRMWPSYYRNSFWLNDPWQYRLPPAYGPYRWVRYHYDAVLVNIYTGEVADIVYDFFW